jgi:predicted TIM-barrel fold metal-dependent hydrolase
LGAHSAILGRDIANLDDLLEAARQQIKNIKKSGAVGIKYFVFFMSEPSVPDAKEALSQIINNKELYLPPINPITHVYFDALLTEVKEQGLVACVHTGYWGDFRELNPSHAIYMFDNYPDVVFDLYHVGYPYVREAIMLGKSRGNVVMNMCWTYIISPHFAREALTEMLEMVPWHKIIGFGGDYTVVEKVYGHLVLARRVMADALAAKVHDGSFTLERAVELARRMMYQNPKDIYKL